MSIRPINIFTDTQNVTNLLNLVFAQESNQPTAKLKRVALSHEPGYQLWGRQLSGGRPIGLVWEENDQIIGNISIFPAPQTPTRFIIANVAVHPQFRRKQIGTALMTATEQFARKYNASTLALQVRPENESAIILYQNLGYKIVGNLNVWRINSRRIQKGLHPHLLNIQPLPKTALDQAYELNQDAFPLELNWPDPLTPDFYDQSWLSQIKDLFYLRQKTHWGYFNNDLLTALISITSTWNSPYELNLRIPPTESIELAYPLLIHAMNFLTTLPRKTGRIQHPPNPKLDTILTQLNWSHYRTLSVMLKSI